MGSACVTRTGTAIAALVALCSLAGCAASADDGRLSDLEVAYNVCSAYPEVTKGDQGHTVIVNTHPGDGIDSATCVLKALKTSDRIGSEIRSTTALMGRQSDQGSGLSYEWSYHPANGLDLTVSDQ